MLTTDLSLGVTRWQDFKTLPGKSGCLQMRFHVHRLNSPIAIWTRSRYLGNDIPEEVMIWQDQFPVNHPD